MRTQLEQEDIEDIAQRVMEKIIPFLHRTQEQDNSVLNVDEVAAMLGKSKGQIYQWVSDSRHGLNTFPYLKAGKSLRFSQKSIIEWMQKHGKTR